MNVCTYINSVFVLADAAPSCRVLSLALVRAMLDLRVGLSHRIYCRAFACADAACMQWVDFKLSVAITAGRPRRSGSLLTIRRCNFWSVQSLTCAAM